MSTSAIEAMFDKMKEDIIIAVGRYVDSAKMEVLQGKDPSTLHSYGTNWPII